MNEDDFNKIMTTFMEHAQSFFHESNKKVEYLLIKTNKKHMNAYLTKRVLRGYGFSYIKPKNRVLEKILTVIAVGALFEIVLIIIIHGS